METRRFLIRLLGVPLAWKIAGANALLTIALTGGFYVLPVTPTNAASSSLLVGVMLAAAVVNVVLISLALRPIHELERVAEALWSGAVEVRVRPSRLADRDVSRVAGTINSLLEKLAADRDRLQLLTAKLVEARSAERAAIAYELTESVAQSVTALALECAALKRVNGDGSRDERLDSMSRAASSLVEEIRRIARDVHPRHIDELGLDTALRSLVREASANASQEFTYVSRGTPATVHAFPRVIAGALYDVAREALQNARRHSSARHIEVSLGLERHAARLTVSDDGCGFIPAACDRASGVGLSLIRERIALVGGSLELLSRPGKGTQVVAIVPLPQPALTTPSTLVLTH